MDTAKLIDEIKQSKKYEDQIVYVKNTPATKFQTKSIELKPHVKYALSEKSINELYSHQVDAIELVREGNNVVLATSTASGKSLAYMIPIFERIIENPSSTALYIAPLNALINDQLKTFSDFRDIMGIDVGVGKFIGQTTQEERRNIKKNGQIILTNPEMLNLSFLQWNQQWSRVFSNLDFVVIDESHSYRGVMGSNMANVLRRFNRICDHYGSSPRYICCTATIGNPEEHTSKLIGKNVKYIDEDGSGSAAQKFVFWNPPLYVNQKGFNVRKSSFGESTDLLSLFVQKDLQTIAFTKARQKVERMSLACQKQLVERACDAKISPYRGGYHGEEREKIENQLSKGELQGVVSTSALEMGINIGTLDACVLDGYPGTIMSTRQRAGRVGRKGNDSIVVLVAGSDALDQYYMRNPDEFFERTAERAVISVSNKFIQAGHLLCAAREISLTTDDRDHFGENFDEIVDALKEEGLLEGDDTMTSPYSAAHTSVSIRGIGKDNYVMFAGTHKRILEKSIETSQAYREAFEGAIFLHLVTPYKVNKMDHATKEIYVTEEKVNYYTRPKINSTIIITEASTKKKLPSCPGINVGFGNVTVNEQVVGYKKFQYYTEEEIGEESLEMPPYSLETESFWLEIPERLKEMVEKYDRDFAGGIHAIEHAIIAMYPLHLLVDRNDMGGVSTTEHIDLNNSPAIFVYDGHQGGVGYAVEGYEQIIELLKVTLDSIEKCPCDEGCPSCVQSPKCGNNNEPLDKHAAVMILSEMLGLPVKEPPMKKIQKTQTEDHQSEKAALLSENSKNPSNADHADALKRACQKLRKHDTKSTAELISMGKKAADPSEAYNYFEKALLLEPRNKEALQNKGLIAFNLSKYKEALECFNELLNNGSRDWKTLKLKGKTLHELGNYRGAIDAYSEALDRNDNDYELRELLRKAENAL